MSTVRSFRRHPQRSGRSWKQRLEDLEGAEAAATLSEITEETREKLQEASPEIRASWKPRREVLKGA